MVNKLFALIAEKIYFIWIKASRQDNIPEKNFRGRESQYFASGKVRKAIQRAFSDFEYDLKKLGGFQ